MLLVLPYYNYGKKKARETEKKVRGKNPGLRRTFSRICSKTFCTTTIGRKKRGKPKKKVRACAEHFPVFFSKTFCTTTTRSLVVHAHAITYGQVTGIL
jgi:hypothetical protein